MPEFIKNDLLTPMQIIESNSVRIFNCLQLLWFRNVGVVWLSVVVTADSEAKGTLVETDSSFMI